MKLNPDRRLRAMALLVAVPVIVLCYHKHPFAGGSTDTFIAGVSTLGRSSFVHCRPGRG
jgi:hypothetical protein